MVDRGTGAQYRPSPGPQGSDAALTQWCQREFDRISVSINEGRSEFLRLDLSAKLPAKPLEGTVYYFKAGVVGVGSLKGYYGYDGSTWSKF